MSMSEHQAPNPEVPPFVLPGPVLDAIRQLLARRQEQTNALDGQITQLAWASAAGAGFDMTALRVVSIDAKTGVATLAATP